MSKGVREITDLLNGSKLRRHAVPYQEIAHVGFRTDKKFIRQDIKRTQNKLSPSGKLFNILSPVRLDIKIILNGNHLAIKNEMPEIRLRQNS